ncbi:hypothetical protein PFISCL1PPCAC_8292 [Pristionchus fissidentatus]|uniref:RNA binding protein n=1 Tax=Pristionchus fissidentatus TaxID=1538716 RepID=A0AAV5VGD9_9BILA|nr:hypothetical protein PFISCL1PPCAC_8292 [Pristionchus fissidentatus]
MDARASFRLPGEKVFGAGGLGGLGGPGKPPQAMFKALRRLHGHNLENQGLNDLTEAFQSFVTRARFFSVGKLRRTWSHSAVEFMKYRRLLPMILSDGQAFDGGETDDFDAALAFQANTKDDRKIIVTNVSSRVTPPQLQAFFTQFGKIAHCSLPREDGKKTSIFATMGRSTKTCGVATITFKTAEGAQKARDATQEQLMFYNQAMVVQAYVSRKRGGKGMVMSDDSKYDDDRQSMTSSTQSLSSGHGAELISPDDLPPAALERVLAFLPLQDTIRLERVSKKWLETSMKSWSQINSLSLYRDADHSFFTKSHPLRNSQLRAILSRAGAHLRRLDLNGIVHLLDSKALQIIAEHCPNLVELDLSGVRATADALQELSETLPGLRVLSYRDMINANDKALWFLVKGCARSLRVVDLRGSRRMNGRCLRLFGQSLEQLLLDGCSRVDERALEDLCTGAVGLKELRLNECFLLSDENINMMARSLSELQVLTLCGGRFSRLSQDGLMHIARMEQLVELALDYNPLVSDDLLEAVALSLPHLASLSISNAGTDQSITGRGIEAVARMKQLEQVDVSCLAAVKNATLVEMAANLAHLEVLQLRNCVYLGDEGVGALAGCSRLRHLDLSGSMLVTAAAVQQLIKARPADEKEDRPTVTIVVGGTAVDAGQLRVRGSRVAINFSDFSSITGLAASASSMAMAGGEGRMRRSASLHNSDDEDSDDDFESLTAHRSFYMDAVAGEDDSPLDEKEMLEWAEREAKELGLLK